MVNAILHVIERNDFDADVNFEPEISNASEIKEELYQEATVASKAEADRIARSVNNEIKGLYKLVTDDCYDYAPYIGNSGGEVGDLCIDEVESYNSYAQLSKQQTEITVTVKGIWKTE